MTLNIKKAEELAEKVYNTTAVLNYYCKAQGEEELLERIVPVMEHLHRDSDKLYAMFFDDDDD